MLGGLALGAGLLAPVALPLAHPMTTLALATSSRSAGGSSLSTGSWAYYLHNNPTPPSGATTAQAGLPGTHSAPSATTLQNYDSDCDTRAGRGLQISVSGLLETDLCRYTSWQLPVLASPLVLNGTVTLRTWTRKAGSGSTPSLVGYLRDYNPATGTYAEIATATTNVTGSSFGTSTLAWTINRTIAAGHQLELKLVAASGTPAVDIAYDTTTYPTRLVLLQQPAA